MKNRESVKLPTIVEVSESGSEDEAPRLERDIARTVKAISRMEISNSQDKKEENNDSKDQDSKAKPPKMKQIESDKLAKYKAQGAIPRARKPAFPIAGPSDSTAKSELKADKEAASRRRDNYEVPASESGLSLSEIRALRKRMGSDDGQDLPRPVSARSSHRAKSFENRSRPRSRKDDYLEDCMTVTKISISPSEIETSSGRPSSRRNDASGSGRPVSRSGYRIRLRRQRSESPPVPTDYQEYDLSPPRSNTAVDLSRPRSPVTERRTAPPRIDSGEDDAVAGPSTLDVVRVPSEPSRSKLFDKLKRTPADDSQDLAKADPSTEVPTSTKLSRKIEVLTKYDIRDFDLTEPDEDFYEEDLEGAAAFPLNCDQSKARRFHLSMPDVPAPSKAKSSSDSQPSTSAYSSEKAVIVIVKPKPAKDQSLSEPSWRKLALTSKLDPYGPVFTFKGDARSEPQPSTSRLSPKRATDAKEQPKPAKDFALPGPSGQQLALTSKLLPYGSVSTSNGRPSSESQPSTSGISSKKATVQPKPAEPSSYGKLSSAPHPSTSGLSSKKATVTKGQPKLAEGHSPQPSNSGLSSKKGKVAKAQPKSTEDHSTKPSTSGLARKKAIVGKAEPKPAADLSLPGPSWQQLALTSNLSPYAPEFHSAYAYPNSRDGSHGLKSSSTQQKKITFSDPEVCEEVEPKSSKNGNEGSSSSQLEDPAVNEEQEYLNSLDPAVPTPYMSLIETLILLLEHLLNGLFRMSNNFHEPEEPSIVSNTMRSIRSSLEPIIVQFSFAQGGNLEPLTATLRGLLSPAVNLVRGISPEIEFPNMERDDVIIEYPNPNESPENRIPDDRFPNVHFLTQIVEGLTYYVPHQVLASGGPPRIPFNRSSDEQPFAGAFVTPDGFIRLHLPFTVQIDITIDGAICFRNVHDDLTVCISALGNHSAILSPFCRVHQHNSILELLITDEYADRTMYAIIGTLGVTFGGTVFRDVRFINKNGRTVSTNVPFTEINPDFINLVFNQHSQNGPIYYEKCRAALRKCKSRTFRDGSVIFTLKDIRISHFSTGDITISRDQWNFIIAYTPPVPNVRRGQIRLTTPSHRTIASVINVSHQRQENNIFRVDFNKMGVYYDDKKFEIRHENGVTKYPHTGKSANRTDTIVVVAEDQKQYDDDYDDEDKPEDSAPSQN